MTEKRFENRLNKNNIKFNTLNPVWDNLKEDALNVFEMIEVLNKLSDENNNLKKDNEKLKQKQDWLIERLCEIINYLQELGYEVGLEDENDNYYDLTN